MWKYKRAAMRNAGMWSLRISVGNRGVRDVLILQIIFEQIFNGEERVTRIHQKDVPWRRNSQYTFPRVVVCLECQTTHMTIVPVPGC